LPGVVASVILGGMREVTRILSAIEQATCRPPSNSGRTMREAADLLGLSLRGAHRLWAYAKAWLLEELQRH
jgi:hypothetical protein